MNRIVKEHYPAAKLPVELREGIDTSSLVTVTVQEEAEEQKPLSRDQLRKLIEQAQKEAKGGTLEDAVQTIRSLRDEWDD